MSHGLETAVISLIVPVRISSNLTHRPLPTPTRPSGGRAVDASALSHQADVISACVAQLREMYSQVSTDSLPQSSTPAVAPASDRPPRAPDVSYFDQKVVPY